MTYWKPREHSIRSQASPRTYDGHEFRLRLSACGPLQYRCVNGQCISEMFVSDKQQDCSDNTDEGKPVCLMFLPAAFMTPPPFCSILRPLLELFRMRLFVSVTRLDLRLSYYPGWNLLPSLFTVGVRRYGQYWSSSLWSILCDEAELPSC